MLWSCFVHTCKLNSFICLVQTVDQYRTPFFLFFLGSYATQDIHDTWQQIGPSMIRLVLSFNGQFDFFLRTKLTLKCGIRRPFWCHVYPLRIEFESDSFFVKSKEECYWTIIIHNRSDRRVNDVSTSQVHIQSDKETGLVTCPVTGSTGRTNWSKFNNTGATHFCRFAKFII